MILPLFYMTSIHLSFFTYLSFCLKRNNLVSHFQRSGSQRVALNIFCIFFPPTVFIHFNSQKKRTWRSLCLWSSVLPPITMLQLSAGAFSTPQIQSTRPAATHHSFHFSWPSAQHCFVIDLRFNNCLDGSLKLFQFQQQFNPNKCKSFYLRNNIVNIFYLLYYSRSPTVICNLLLILITVFVAADV